MADSNGLQFKFKFKFNFIFNFIFKSLTNNGFAERSRLTLWFWILFTSVGISIAGRFAYAAGPSCESLFTLGREQTITFEVPPSAIPKMAVTRKILDNISRVDTKAGSVVAATTKTNPNYYFHWVRDAALVTTAVTVYESEFAQPSERPELTKKLLEYVDYSEQLQKTPTQTGLGEPKFNVDGTAFNEPWGRPQNDGPALRALSNLHIYKLLAPTLSESRLARIQAIIKTDLEYVSHHWQEPSFDLWEEVKGDHFYTRMVQASSLLSGAQFFRSHGDSGAADYYSSQGQKAEKSLNAFWDPVRRTFLATLNRQAGLDYKSSNLDIATILAFDHVASDEVIASQKTKILATIEQLLNSFGPIYAVNKFKNEPGLAVGRYPEDRYSGAGREGGNPWPLATLAIAEMYFRLAKVVAATDPAEARTYFQLGDGFVKRVLIHAGQDGSLSEQFDKNSGYMTSVENLTWNYAAEITMSHAREKAKKALTSQAGI